MRMTDEQIATELRALRPTPSEQFAAELDAWVAEGFSARGRATGKARTAPGPLNERLLGALRPPRWRRLVPALGALATAVVVIGVAISTTGDGGDEPQTLQAPTGDEAAPQVAPQPERAAGDAAIEPAPSTVAPMPPVPGEQLKPGRERVQERSASMALSTEPNQVDEVADGVVDVTDRYDGIVVSSNVDTSDGEGRANFDLRIPTQSLQAALADLSDLAHVSSRNEGTLDITAPFVGAEERFADARAEVDTLLDQLADADTAAEVAAIREQLRLARQELAAARTELGSLKQRADFSRLSVTVLGSGEGDGWSISDAADDAIDVLEALGGATLITLAVLIPLGVVSLLAWLGFTKLRHRRRESALDE